MLWALYCAVSQDAEGCGMTLVLQRYIELTEAAFCTPTGRLQINYFLMLLCFVLIVVCATSRIIVSGVLPCRMITLYNMFIKYLLLSKFQEAGYLIYTK